MTEYGPLLFLDIKTDFYLNLMTVMSKIRINGDSICENGKQSAGNSTNILFSLLSTGQLLS